MDEVPAHIAHLRHLLGPHGTLKRVSDATGIPYSTLANFKAGQTEMSNARVELVAKALGRRVMLIEDPQSKDARR